MERLVTPQLAVNKLFLFTGVEGLCVCQYYTCKLTGGFKVVLQYTCTDNVTAVISQDFLSST